MSENFENDGKLILAREYKSIYRLMIHLWDEFVELLGDEIVTFKEYTQMLEAGISEGIVGFIPPTAKQVMIGDVTRSRLKILRSFSSLVSMITVFRRRKGHRGF